MWIVRKVDVNGKEERRLPIQYDQEAENQETSITIEYLALGKNRKLGILSGSKDRHIATAPTTNLSAVRQTQDCPVIVQKMRMETKFLQEILAFHRSNVQWQHACIHSQTFDRQVKVYTDMLDWISAPVIGYEARHFEFLRLHCVHNLLCEGEIYLLKFVLLSGLLLIFL